MSEPTISKAQPPETLSLLAIARGVVTSRDCAIRIMIGVLGAVALGWLGPLAALLGLVLSQLLGDVVKEIVTTRKWSLRRIWFVVALALLFEFVKRLWPRGARRTAHRPTPTPIAAPLVSTLAATVVVVGAFTVADVARGQSFVNKHHTTFFGGLHHRATAPSLRLPDGRVVTSAASLTFRAVRVGSSSPPESLVLSSGSEELRHLKVDASPAAFRLENGCTHRLPPNARCSVTVVFQPDHAGHVDGRLTISFVHDPELTLELIGTALAVVTPTLAPASLSFGRTGIGSAAGAQKLTLRAGSTPLAITHIASASGEFAVAAGNCPDHLDAGEACIIRVRFTPAAAGTRHATLTVARNGGLPLTADLIGVGAPHATRQPTLRPAQADLGSVQLGSSSPSATFTLTADSSALPVANVTVSNDYRISANGCPDRLAARRSCTIEVVFVPTAAGRRDGKLTVAGRAAHLHGTGTSPTEPTLAPGRYDFGTVQLGKRSPAQSFTLTAGSSALTSVSVATHAKDYLIESNDCGTQLVAHSSCTIVVTFAPTAAGSRDGKLTVARRAAHLHGTGTSPTEPTLAPGRYDFGTVQLGKRSPAQSFTLTAGSSALTSVSVATHAKDYVIESDDCGTQLVAHSSCTIVVTFAPTAAGTREGTLTAAGLSASLTGSGLAIAPTLSPDHADFGTVQLGKRSPAQSFTLTAGSSALTSVSVATHAKDYVIESDDCGTQLVAHSSCTIVVTFAPTAAGTRDGTLTAARLSASLTGSGLAIAPTLSPDHADFATVRVGERSTKPATFTLAAGSSPLPIAGVGVNSKDYRITANGCPARLDPSRTCTISVTFAPVAEGARPGTLVVSRSNGRAPLAAALTGTGRAIDPTLTPSSFDFGGVQVGASSKPTHVRITAGSSSFPYASATPASRDFRITANTCNGALAPRSTCTITVVFAPVVGAKRAATLTVKRSDGGTPLTASLTGVGLWGIVTLLPTSLDFGNVCTDCGTRGPSKTVELVNNGTAPLTIRDIGSSDSRQFAISNNCPKLLPADGKCTFAVKFTPASPGLKRATITVTADGGGRHSLAAQGSGVVG